MANQTIYPYGMNGQLPSSIGVINDLTTGGADKALSAEQGVVLNNMLNPYTELNLSAITGIQAFIVNATNTWSEAQSGYTCWLIPVTAGALYEIRASQNYEMKYAFLTSNSHANGTQVSFATGYTGRRVLTADTSTTITSPSDANYLYILVNENGDDVTPQFIKEKVQKNITERLDGIIINDLTTGGENKALSAEQGKVLFEAIDGVTINLSRLKQIDALIRTSDQKWVEGLSPYKCIFVPVVGGTTYQLIGNTNNNSSYTVLTSDEHVRGTFPDYATGYSKKITLNAGDTISITMPLDAAYMYILIVGDNGIDTTPSLIKQFSAIEQKIVDAIKENENLKNEVPKELILGEPTTIIYTIDDFMLAHEYDSSQDIDNLKFSNDLGQTWITISNTYGTIVNAFMFADGTFMMACKKDEGCRIYWTRDFDTFTEATVLDYNGNPYSIEAGKTRFYIPKPRSEHVYVNGIEHYCFWDYIITTTNPRMWYAISDENGVTVRAALAFGYSSVNGSVLGARHGHAFEYNPYDGYFYALTGDNVSECHVLKGRYVDNNGTHTWTWEKLATGGGYKLVSVSFDEGNMYALTDYTESSLASYKGLVSIPIDKIGLTTTIGGIVCPLKLRYWFHATDEFMRQGSYYSGNPAALSLGKLVDNHGWRFMGTDYLGGSMHLIAKGDHNFVWVDNNKGIRFNSLTGPNNKGDVYVTYSTPPLSVSGESWLKLSHQKTYNLTEAMRNSGATDFFDGWLGTPR